MGYQKHTFTSLQEQILAFYRVPQQVIESLKHQESGRYRCIILFTSNPQTYVGSEHIETHRISSSSVEILDPRQSSRYMCLTNISTVVTHAASDCIYSSHPIICWMHNTS